MSDKLDAFCHVLPRDYADRLFALDGVPAVATLCKRLMNIPVLVDPGVRFRQLDEFPGYRQIINLAAPPVEDFGSPAVSTDFARRGNDGLAELAAKHPDRFAGFCAAVALNDVDAAVTELDHAVKELGAVGVQIYTHVQGHPLDEDRFEPFWKRCAELDLLIQVHPCRNSSWPTTRPRNAPSTRSGGPSAGSTTCPRSWPTSSSPASSSATRTSSS
ncbi:amidohydrolase family protein [Streptomyces sp. NPDC004237]|uniref:amidohydrolase family protein n=1 Tax=Streptomyces sp. NPDC004237 TaxID=3154455 RepID=UPI0033B077E8